MLKISDFGNAYCFSLFLGKTEHWFTRRVFTWEKALEFAFEIAKPLNLVVIGPDNIFVEEPSNAAASHI